MVEDIEMIDESSQQIVASNNTNTGRLLHT